MIAHVHKCLCLARSTDVRCLWRTEEVLRAASLRHPRNFALRDAAKTAMRATDEHYARVYPS